MLIRSKLFDAGVLDLRRAVQEDPSLVGARELLSRIYLQEARSRLERGGEGAEKQARAFAQRAIPLTRSAEPFLLLVVPDGRMDRRGEIMGVVEHEAGG